MLSGKWIIVSGIAALALATGITLGLTWYGKPGFQPKKYSEIALYLPIPPGGETAWMVDYVTKQERNAETPSYRSALHEMRKRAGQKMSELPESTQAGCWFVAERLPHYSVKELLVHVPATVRYLHEGIGLFEHDWWKKRTKEYINEIGKDEFKKRHPNQSMLVEMVNG